MFKRLWTLEAMPPHILINIGLAATAAIAASVAVLLCSTLP